MPELPDLPADPDELWKLDQQLEAQYGYEMLKTDLEQTVVSIGRKLRGMVNEAGGDFDPMTFAYAFLIGVTTSQEMDPDSAEAWLGDLERDGLFQRVTEAIDDDSLES